MKRLLSPAIAILVLLVLVGSIAAQDIPLSTSAPSALDKEKAQELARVEKLAEELLQKVSVATGLQIMHPVTIAMVTKQEVQEFMLKTLEEEYPGDLLQRQADAYAMFGLLPEGFDLKGGLVALMTEQAAAFYDPRTDTFYAIIDLPEQFKNPFIERTITAHELTHALQDQAVDILAMQQAAKENTDRSYAISAVLEGQASVAMTTFFSGARGDTLPDLGAAMRQSMSMMGGMAEMQVFASSPKYLQEVLISPYAEGASFVQAFLRANPEAQMAALLENFPDSSEQILHYEKYRDNDLPTQFDLSGIDAVMPPGWEQVFSDTLGEFDVRVMHQIHEATAENAVEIGAGWDGVDFATYRNGDLELLAGASIWDSEADAAEFADGMLDVLAATHGPDGAAVKTDGAHVAFLAGDLAGLPVENLLDALLRAPARETFE